MSPSQHDRTATDTMSPTHSTWIHTPNYGYENPQVNPPFQYQMPASYPSQGDVSRQQILDITRKFAEQVSLSRLSPSEPSVFHGDPLKYPGWKCSFETSIDQKNIPPIERIHYLKNYLGGSAKEAIEEYFLLTTVDSYDEARALLEERYGDPFLVANAFGDKLDAWPKIPIRDGQALRKFTNFLRQCQMAMQTIGGLEILNDNREIRKLVMKVPDWAALQGLGWSL